MEQQLLQAEQELQDMENRLQDGENAEVGGPALLRFQFWGGTIQSCSYVIKKSALIYYGNIL